jgi:hypothetical protein
MLATNNAPSFLCALSLTSSVFPSDSGLVLSTQKHEGDGANVAEEDAWG